MKKKLLYLALLASVVVGLLPVGVWSQEIIHNGMTTSSWQNPNQRKTLEAEGLLWVFYADSGIKYEYSDDNGTTWSGQQGIVSSGTEGLNIYYDGISFYLATRGGGTIYFHKGHLHGNGTIDFDHAEVTAVTGSLDGTNNGFGLAVDSGGHPWIGYLTSGLDGYVSRSSETDGGWTNDVGFPYSFSSYNGMTSFSILPLPSDERVIVIGYVYQHTLVARRWTGAAWGAEQELASNHCMGFGSAVLYGDYAEVVYLEETTNDLLFTTFSYSSQSWGSVAEIYAAASATSYPVITLDDSNDRWVFWANDPSSNHVYTMKYDRSEDAWSTEQDLCTDANTIPNGLYINTPRYSPRDNLGVYWLSGASSNIVMYKSLGEQFHVDTDEATSITETEATLNGEIVSIGWGTPIERGFYWDTTPSLGNSTGTLQLWYETGSFGTGVFSHTVSDLEEGESYYCIAYATNAETVWGEWVEVVAGGTDGWAVLTLPPDPVGDFEATFWGNITEVAGTYATVRGFEWGYTATPTWSWEATGNFTVGTYSHEITTLEADTIYYVRAVAGNATTHDHGQWIGFITQQPSYQDEENPPGDDTGLTPPIPSEPGGWIRPPKDWGNIGLPGAQIPLTFFVWILLTGFVVLVGFGITKFTRSLAVLFMVLGFILGIFSFWPKGGYLDWWIMLPYFLVGWALLSRQKDSPISE
ncbi:hypothetical protein [Candidatus Magnetobacterium casense]|uniref:Fibronectin type-III domain-containing protein n=1 Tax=Candidatus Magnetobacterium casense TaxID=1455061 RepID=A0ABS6RXA2_9BACT|nr:hypothetical protein [Candidatus Magnetobacterium casensis]MBV6341216.1 hypothetical protein [Candidatus Magnetobacterium casensis]